MHISGQSTLPKTAKFHHISIVQLTLKVSVILQLHFIVAIRSIYSYFGIFLIEIKFHHSLSEITERRSK